MKLRIKKGQVICVNNSKYQFIEKIGSDKFRVRKEWEGESFYRVLGKRYLLCMMQWAKQNGTYKMCRRSLQDEG
jgi:hypothetical protein